MNAKVLDACAIIAFLQGEPGSDAIEDLLTNPLSKCYLHAINASEVYAWYLKRGTQPDATAAVTRIVECGIELRDDIDLPFWKEVAALKATITTTTDPASGRRRTISLADCFVIALARRLNGRPVTSDHREFEYVNSSGICPVEFFR